VELTVDLIDHSIKAKARRRGLAAVEVATAVL
jgi:hypothetical protein